MSELFSAGRVVTGDAVIERGWVHVASGRIVEVGGGMPPATDVVVDAPDGTLTPGFVDLHCHGGAGGGFDDGNDAIRAGLEYHRAHGTTRQLLSLVTGEVSAIRSYSARSSALGRGVSFRPHQGPRRVRLRIDGLN